MMSRQLTQERPVCPHCMLKSGAPAYLTLIQLNFSQAMWQCLDNSNECSYPFTDPADMEKFLVARPLSNIDDDPLLYLPTEVDNGDVVGVKGGHNVRLQTTDDQIKPSTPERSRLLSGSKALTTDSPKADLSGYKSASARPMTVNAVKNTAGQPKRQGADAVTTKNVLPLAAFDDFSTATPSETVMTSVATITATTNLVDKANISFVASSNSGGNSIVSLAQPTGSQLPSQLWFSASPMSQPSQNMPTVADNPVVPAGQTIVVGSEQIVGPPIVMPTNVPLTSMAGPGQVAAEATATVIEIDGNQFVLLPASAEVDRSCTTVETPLQQFVLAQRSPQESFGVKEDTDSLLSAVRPSTVSAKSPLNARKASAIPVTGVVPSPLLKPYSRSISSSSSVVSAGADAASAGRRPERISRLVSCDRFRPSTPEPPIVMQPADSAAILPVILDPFYEALLKSGAFRGRGTKWKFGDPVETGIMHFANALEFGNCKLEEIFTFSFVTALECGKCRVFEYKDYFDVPSISFQHDGDCNWQAEKPTVPRVPCQNCKADVTSAVHFTKLPQFLTYHFPSGLTEDWIKHHTLLFNKGRHSVGESEFRLCYIVSVSGDEKMETVHFYSVEGSKWQKQTYKVWPQHAYRPPCARQDHHESTELDISRDVVSDEIRLLVWQYQSGDRASATPSPVMLLSHAHGHRVSPDPTEVKAEAPKVYKLRKKKGKQKAADAQTEFSDIDDDFDLFGMVKSSPKSRRGPPEVAVRASIPESCQTTSNVSSYEDILEMEDREFDEVCGLACADRSPQQKSVNYWLSDNFAKHWLELTTKLQSNQSLIAADSSNYSYDQVKFTDIFGSGEKTRNPVLPMPKNPPREIDEADYMISDRLIADVVNYLVYDPSVFEVQLKSPVKKLSSRKTDGDNDEIDIGGESDIEVDESIGDINKTTVFGQRKLVTSRGIQRVITPASSGRTRLGGGSKRAPVPDLTPAAQLILSNKKPAGRKRKAAGVVERITGPSRQTSKSNDMSPVGGDLFEFANPPAGFKFTAGSPNAPLAPIPSSLSTEIEKTKPGDSVKKSRELAAPSGRKGSDGATNRRSEPFKTPNPSHSPEIHAPKSSQNIANSDLVSRGPSTGNDPVSDHSETDKLLILFAKDLSSLSSDNVSTCGSDKVISFLPLNDAAFEKRSTANLVEDDLGPSTPTLPIHADAADINSKSARRGPGPESVSFHGDQLQAPEVLQVAQTLAPKSLVAFQSKQAVANSTQPSTSAGFADDHQYIYDDQDEYDHRNNDQCDRPGSSTLPIERIRPGRKTRKPINYAVLDDQPSTSEMECATNQVHGDAEAEPFSPAVRKMLESKQKRLPPRQCRRKNEKKGNGVDDKINRMLNDAGADEFDQALLGRIVKEVFMRYKEAKREYPSGDKVVKEVKQELAKDPAGRLALVRSPSLSSDRADEISLESEGLVSSPRYDQLAYAKNKMATGSNQGFPGAPILTDEKLVNDKVVHQGLSGVVPRMDNVYCRKPLDVLFRKAVLQKGAATTSTESCGFGFAFQRQHASSKFSSYHSDRARMNEPKKIVVSPEIRSSTSSASASPNGSPRSAAVEIPLAAPLQNTFVPHSGPAATALARQPSTSGYHPSVYQSGVSAASTEIVLPPPQTLVVPTTTLPVTMPHLPSQHPECNPATSSMFAAHGYSSPPPSDSFNPSGSQNLAVPMTPSKMLTTNPLLLESSALHIPSQQNLMPVVNADHPELSPNSMSLRRDVPETQITANQWYFGHDRQADMEMGQSASDMLEEQYTHGFVLQEGFDFM